MSQPSGFRSLLAPLTPLYRLGLYLRERRLASGREPLSRLRSPVISIGNLSTGGSGKTPLAIALARALTAHGYAVDVLSRGYGRTSSVPLQVEVKGPAALYGDEPILIARHTGVPVFVAPRRYDAGLLAEAACAGEPATASRKVVHLLDDAFQHRRLHRDIDILLLSRDDLSDRLLPAGNLREPLQAIRRAHVVAIPAADTALASPLRALGFAGPVWRLHRILEVPPALIAAGGSFLAFCGIARPDQFFNGLASTGVRLVGRRAFPDHHRYTQRDLDSLVRQARGAGATLLTTEKDAVRLETLRAHAPIGAIPLRIAIEDETAALHWLADRLQALLSHAEN